MRALTVIGWFLSLALLVGIAGPFFGTCTQGSDSPWSAGLLFFAPVGLLGLALARAGASTMSSYRWLALPHVATVIAAAYLIPIYFSQTTLAGHHVCSVRDGGGFSAPVTLVQQLWAPSWLAIICLLGYVVLSCWRVTNARSNG